MDGFTLTAEIVKAVTSMVAAFAWPIGLLGVLLSFRKKLNELLPLLILKYKDVQISFGLDKAEEDAKRLPEPPEPELVPAPDVDEKSRLDALARLSPRAAIMQARADIETAVNSFASAVGMSRGRASFPKTVSELDRNQLIDKTTVDLLHELRQIGNAAAHNMSEPTETEALRYQELAYRLVRQFEIATRAAAMPSPGPIPTGLP
ncbi:DUF4145 domain-containing protein [Bradyrhizobium sp. GCM10023182]|uniref:DUF4145 domain-containing protein n=1 Tax=Bradyrhizobium zhengyangense TaxID=2911009 RepID=A0ABS9LG72_9BRAD|nr:DUF4145 domain-containing protein [Bradyrhizobium zhengyangense]MCG2665943.1 DUF4145 domain-containing protein [Bradyrhizobium zhengyangense]